MSAFETLHPTPDSVVVKFATTVLGGIEAVELADILRANLDTSASKIVFDLANVVAMNSSGLGMLVSSLATLRKTECALILTNMPPKVTQLLQITQLTQVFTIYSTTEEALAAP